MDDTERLKGLRKLCGYVENGSSTSVIISQDDATRSWVIHVGKRWYWGYSFNEAIDKALAEEKPE